LRHADKNAEADMQPDRIGRKGRPDQAERIEERAEQDDAPGAIFVGERADEGLGQPEQKILERHGKAEIGPTDPDIDAHLREKQAERLAHAHRKRDDERGAGDDDPRPLHGGECGGGHMRRMRPQRRGVKRA
jgi:hypothetical protein